MGSAHEAYDAVMGPRARRGVRVSPPEPGGKDPMALFTAAETAAMRRALRLAASPDAPPGPNPRVGCVIVSAEGRILAEGHHRGAGTAHAEVDALTRAGERARGAVAVITLEPCDHRGRTGPCTRALLDAGIAEVVYAQDDPNPLAAGGAARLRKAGVRVRSGLCRREAERLNRAWTFAVTRGRPLVTWKLAASLDGRVAAADSTSRWITPSVARRDAHSLRRECDAIIHLTDGKWGAIEIKLGAGRTTIDKAAENLLKFSEIVDVEQMKEPSYLMILSGISSYAYRRPDGVLVVPIGCLRD